MRFELDRRRVVHETIDGEVILIHMETGFYYSLEGPGSEIWDALVAGCGPDEIARPIADALSSARPARSKTRLRLSPRSFAGNGCSIGRMGSRRTARRPRHRRRAGATDEPARGIRSAHLHRYTDMADFMLVDPIHEVEDSGWPNRKVAP